MKYTTALGCMLFCILIAGSRSVEYEKDDDGSLILTELNFHRALEEHEYLFVQFHALWCRYSKKMKPEWKSLVTMLKGSNVVPAKVEAYDEKKIADEYDVEGYPQMKLFIKKQPHDYNGERKDTHLFEFVERKLKKKLSEVASKKAIQDKLLEYEWIGIYNPGDSSQAVIDAAFDLTDVLFVSSSDSSIVSEYGVEKGKFSLVNNITKQHYVLDSSVTAENVKKFVEEHKFPGVPRFSKGTAERVFLSEKPSLILFSKGNSDAEKAFKEAASSLQKEIFMTVAEQNEEISKLLAENLGVGEKEFPTMRIVRPDMERIRKWRSKGAITADSVKKFFEDYKKKEAERYYISEPVPTENIDLVKKVVGATFEEMVIKSPNDVLVLFWAPWCGHCRAMMPVYDNVARKTRLVDNFVVAKIDVSVNEIEQYGLDIVEYPTILLFTKKDKKNPIEFKGERNEYAFNDFIRSHASVPLNKMKGPNPFDRNEL